MRLQGVAASFRGEQELVTDDRSLGELVGSHGQRVSAMDVVISREAFEALFQRMVSVIQGSSWDDQQFARR